MRIEMHTTVDKELLSKWIQLWKRASFANYTNSPYWFLSVCEAFGLTNYICIAVFDDTKLAAIGVLFKKRKYLTYLYSVEPGDFVSGLPFLIDTSNKKVIRAFVKALEQLEIVLLDNVPEEFTTLLGKNTRNITQIPQAINHFLAITKDKNGNIELVNRKILMRRVRNEESHFIMHAYEGTTKKGLNIAIKIDTISRKQTGGYNTFANETVKKFFTVLAKQFKEYISFNILYYKKVPIAFEIGFIINHIYFGNQISFSEEYKKYSPGKVIVVRLIEYLASRKVTTMDLGSGDAHLKRLIATDHRQLYHVIITRNKGLIAYIKTRKKIKSSLYNFMQTHPQVYSFYRKIKNRKK